MMGDMADEDQIRRWEIESGFSRRICGPWIDEECGRCGHVAQEHEEEYFGKCRKCTCPKFLSVAPRARQGQR